MQGRYENKINIVQVNIKKPMVKIINIYMNIEEADIMEVMFQQNKGIRQIREQFALKRSYEVVTDKRKYRNAVIECESVKA